MSLTRVFTAEVGTLAGFGLVAGEIAFSLDSRECPVHLFQPAYTVVGTGGRLEFNDDSAVDFNLNLTAGGGSFGTISAITSPFVSVGRIHMPNGGGILSGYPKKPTRVCVRFTVILIPVLPPLPRIECRYELCMDLQNTTSTGGVVLGTGTVNWTGWASNPVLTSLP